MTGPSRSLKALFLSVIDRLSADREALIEEQKAQEAAADLKWELSDGQHTLSWTPLEKELLYQQERKPSALAAHLSTETQPVNTMLLGFNPQDNSVIIDTFWPSLHANEGAVGQDAHLRIQSGIYTLYLQTRLLDIIQENGDHAFMARVINKTLNRDRRINPRINFNPGEAPQVCLLIPMSGAFHGTVVNLSKGGLEMRCLSPTKPKLESHFGECTLVLTESLQIKCDIKIRNLQWVRQPHSHLRISLVFIGLSSEKTEQLSAFINALTPADSQVA